MTSKELEDSIYDYGETMKQIGKAETNDKIGTKEYNKLIDYREKLIKKFDEHFKTDIRLSKSLNLV